MNLLKELCQVSSELKELRGNIGCVYARLSEPIPPERQPFYGCVVSAETDSDHQVYHRAREERLARRAELVSQLQGDQVHLVLRSGARWYRPGSDVFADRPYPWRQDDVEDIHDGVVVGLAGWVFVSRLLPQSPQLVSRVVEDVLVVVVGPKEAQSCRLIPLESIDLAKSSLDVIDLSSRHQELVAAGRA